MMNQFWDRLLAGSSPNNSTSVDSHLGGKSLTSSFEGVRGLTDKMRAANALALPVEAGTKVVFAGGMGAYLSYEDCPPEGSVGEVVKVKSAAGDITHHDGKVFVQWDDGKLRGIHAEHLRLAGQGKQGYVIRVASLGDLTQFLKRADGKLIHKSTNDLWSYSKDADGNYVIERLFDDEGAPLRDLS
jgi:hypothetical protein